MKRKILFSDLDDTLLDENKAVCQENQKKINQMLEQGHYFVITTGRPVATGKIVVNQLKLTSPGCYMAAFNGAVIYDCAAGQILAQRTIPIHIVREILDEAHKAGIYAHSYQEEYIVAEQYTPELDFYISNAIMEYRLVPDIYSSLQTEPNKIIMIDLEGDKRLLEFQKQHEELLSHCNSFFSRDEFLEICPKDTDKGSAVKYISRFLDIPLENTVAAGDERNDIPMVKAAHIGVAVKNGHPNIKEAADYITNRDCAQGAIAEIIDKFIL